jgi:hypothetical protein
MSKIEVNAVEPQCGTTLTLGASGDTVTLGSGASQSGFGRTGTVDWQTTKKTASFTAVNGEGYFVDTNGGAITATLPASPSAGNIVYIKDYQGTFSTNNCTVARNGSNIRGAASNFSLEKNNSGAVFIYIDATEGWQVFVDGSDADVQTQFITATGGTITCCGNYKIHTFTSPGTFTVCTVSCNTADNEVSYMVVAGGGGGGGMGGGGGGAGGFREYKGSSDCYTASPLNGNPGGTAVTVTAQSYPITVGGGGSAGTGSSPNLGTKGTNGSDSVFSTITSAGGGGGGSRLGPAVSKPTFVGLTGGSGGGTGRDAGVSCGVAGNTPPVSPPQGNPGGSVPSTSASSASGGGGAGAAGSNGSTNDSCGPSSSAGGGPGGNGVATSISGSSVTRAGGGGGGMNNGTQPVGAGGSGGGGSGGRCQEDGGTEIAATAGTANTGGGGGGGSQDAPGNSTAQGKAGGSGIVIIRYKFQ